MNFIEKCKKLLKEKGQKRAWVFRGQKRQAANTKNGRWEWALSTSFERACERFGVVTGRSELERKMIREFKRRLHLYMDHVPDETSHDEWLALMQHYGAPTRLLDFTYSPYVAAYFAFECAEPNTKVAIWAVDATWLKEQLQGCLAEHYNSYSENRTGKDFDALFMSESPNKLVLEINPFRRNERLAYQKGAFLCPGDVTVGFMENLSSFGNPSPGDKVIQYTIPTGKKGHHRDSALRELELMNINRTTLFPGLDGFTQSFSVRMITQFHQ